MPKTKIFCDIADSKTINDFNKKTIVDGFTLTLNHTKSWCLNYENVQKFF